MAKVWKNWNLKVEKHNDCLTRSGKNDELWNPMIIFLPIITGIIAGICIFLFYNIFSVNWENILRDGFCFSSIIAGWTMMFLIANWFVYEQPCYKIRKETIN